MGKFVSAIGIILFLLTACGADTPPPPVTPPMTSEEQAGAAKTGETVAILKTTKGVMKMKFFPQFAPETVKNFQQLAKKNFYNGLTFHRVIPDFMIQGGDPLGTGTGGETYLGPGTTLKAEFSKELKHIRGAVAMARKPIDINSATSQFFIVQNKNGAPFLDGEYTIFGQVFEGLDVVDAIVSVPRDANDKPKTPVKIETITIETES